MPNPAIALVVCTYQKPHHLRRVLASVDQQTGLDGKLEVVVSDDGSTDNTEDVVKQFARDVSYPVRFVTHPHQAFQLSRSRNEGFAATTAPYVVFLDGDCVLPPDHLFQQLKRRRPGVVMGAYCCRLDEATSNRITVDTIQSGEYGRWIPRSELRKLGVLAWKSSFYSLIRHPTKPRLFGGNVAIWREDYEKVNGFDENFVGWGGEDDDMRFRLRAAGVQIRSILHWTRTYHLWHPPDPSAPQSITEGVNMDYLNRRGRFTKCIHGLTKRAMEDLRARIVSPADSVRTDDRLRPLRILQTCGSQRPEIEIVCAPAGERFTGDADYNVLVVLEANSRTAQLAKEAHLVVSDVDIPTFAADRRIPLSEMGAALRDAA